MAKRIQAVLAEHPSAVTAGRRPVPVAANPSRGPPRSLAVALERLDFSLYVEVIVFAARRQLEHGGYLGE